MQLETYAALSLPIFIKGKHNSLLQPLALEETNNVQLIMNELLFIEQCFHKRTVLFSEIIAGGHLIFFLFTTGLGRSCNLPHFAGAGTQSS